MRYALKDSRLGLRNSTTRLPFRYGAATLSRCPQALLEVTIEVEGRPHRGWSGDCLPPGWFDKTPGRSYREQVADLIGSVAIARSAFAEIARKPIGFFDSWLEADRYSRTEGERRRFNPLLAGFGVSLVERAIMDALARAAGLGFSAAIRRDLFRIEPGKVHPELTGLRPADWLPDRPRESVLVRHTVGLLDPLTASEIAEEARVDDGLPQALEESIDRCGLRGFKIKLSGETDCDRDRLARIAAILDRLGERPAIVTLDGNEQFKDAWAVCSLFESLRSEPSLNRLLDRVVAIEQPLERSIALDSSHSEAIRALSAWRPVIIDESDGSSDAYPKALEVGYRGVSSKSCKGPVKSLLNAGVTWVRNDRGARTDLIMTGEDLCSVGVVPVQSDLCLVATLGLGHVERNGHYYHPGLSYLPEADRRAALAAHPDFYAEQGTIIGPAVRDGRFEIGSLRCAGFGFAVEPSFESYTSEEDWRFESLGLDDLPGPTG
ncbi:mandelate racemase [Tautonia sociabilis]|uniref:Mandelate racemase n=1 Tax=Tautonia sociabilis TaxID=2080755 RepID=A0A432MJD6_9BACT|nr:mandelate racemase [Tautonia sociabilis]RUL87340.1 mandelate racemase [Tautonia sociabilis]